MELGNQNYYASNTENCAKRLLGCSSFFEVFCCSKQLLKIPKKNSKNEHLNKHLALLVLSGHSEQPVKKITITRIL
jgi:hypothetical protein